MYTVLVAILVLHRGVQVGVSALVYVSPMKRKSLIVGVLVIYGFTSNKNFILDVGMERTETRIGMEGICITRHATHN